jgi:hypothetical protein
VFGLLKGAWQALPDPSAQTTYVHIHGSSTKLETLIVAGPTSAMKDPGRDWQLLPSAADTRDAIVTPIGTVTIENKQITVRGTSTTSYSTAPVDPLAVWEDPQAHTIYAAGDGGFATLDESTRTVVVTPAPVQIRAISGTSAANAVAGGMDPISGEGVIYLLTPVGWVKLDTQLILKAIADIYIAADGTIFAVSGNAIYVGNVSVSSPWKTMSIPGASLTGVSGTSGSDIFVVGNVTFGLPFSGLAHWDGSHLYPLRLPSASVPHGLYATRGAIYILQSNLSPPTDSIYQLVRATTW